MADVVVTILTPALTGSDYFKTRFRPVSGSYGGNTNRTNAPFTLSGLSVGDYEMEIIFVQVVGSTETNCPATIYEFTVDPTFTCFPFDAEIQQNGALYELVITYTLGSPPVWPACGFDIYWQQGVGATNIIHYATLPLSGEIRYTIPANIDTNVSVLADMCGYFNVCMEETVPKIANPNCIGAIVTSYDIQYTPAGNWNIRMFVTNSNPATSPYTFTFQELSQVPVSMIPDSGQWSAPGNAPATAALYSIPVPGTLHPKGIFLTAPNPNPDDPPIYIPNCIVYNVSFVDYCGNRFMRQVRGLWTPPPAGSPPGTLGTFTLNGC